MLIFSIKFSCFHSIYYDDIIGTLYVPSWSVHNNILLHTHPSFTNKRRALLYHYFKTNSQGHILNLIIYTTQKKTDTFPCLGFFYKEFPKLGLFLSYFPGGALLARTLHGKRHCNWRVHAWLTLVTCWRKAPTQLAIWPDGASGIGALTGLSVGNQQLQQQQQARQPRCAGKRHSQWRVLLDRKALLPLALRGSSSL